MSGPFTLTIKNQQGQPLNGVIITSGQYNTTPVSWPDQDTSGPGSGWNGTSDSNGNIVTNAAYTCPATYSGTLKASGYDDYPYSYESGSVTGPFYQTVEMTASSISGGAPQNVGANAGAGNATDQYYASSTSVTNNLGTSASNLFGGQTGGIDNSLWLIIVIVMVGIFAVLLL